MGGCPKVKEKLRYAEELEEGKKGLGLSPFRRVITQRENPGGGI